MFHSLSVQSDMIAQARASMTPVNGLVADLGLVALFENSHILQTAEAIALSLKRWPDRWLCDPRGWAQWRSLEIVLRNVINLLLLVILLGTASCGPRAKPAPPATTVLASVVGEPPIAVEVQVENLPSMHRIDRIFLVDHEGRKLEAAEFDGRGQPGASQVPPVTMEVGWRSSFNVKFQRDEAAEPGSLTAQIPLSDRDAYLAAPETWTVIVEGRKRNGAPLRYRVLAPRPALPQDETPASTEAQPQTPNP